MRLRLPGGRRGRRLAAAAVLLLLVVGGAGWWAMRSAGDDGRPLRVPLVTRDVRAPDGVRIKVQVLNATSTRGLARRATKQLRDAGFDVVEIGTVPSADRRDSTLVLARSGHEDWAQLVAELLGGARVEARPDSSRYLDLTILLGRSWRPPPETFHP